MDTMFKLFMTSSPMGAYRSAEAPSFRGLDPSNGLVDELKRYWKEDTRCLLISAFPDEYSVNDHSERPDCLWNAWISATDAMGKILYRIWAVMIW